MFINVHNSTKSKQYLNAKSEYWSTLKFVKVKERGKMTERVHKNSSYLNGKSTTGTQTRVKDTSPTSGMCPICIRDCPFLCEISLSAFRGREALYPEPVQFGYSTAGALKDFGLDWSHFNIPFSPMST
jgi:hypothetical protein